MKNKIFILLLLASTGLISSCTSTSKVYQVDYTYLYDHDQKIIKPKFKLFHEQLDSSILYFQFSSNDVLYGKFGQDSSSMANLKMKYRIKLENKSGILDSMTVDLVDFGENNENSLLQGKIKLKLAPDLVYDIELRFRDEFRDLNVVHYLKADKRKNGNEQFFLIKQNENVLISNTLNENQEIEIFKSPLIAENDFILETSNQESAKAAPPFTMAVLNEKIFHTEFRDTVRFENNKLNLNISDKITRITPLNQDNFNAFYIFYYYDGYPELINSEHLIEPLRYISTTNEYNELKMAGDKHNAVENFWIALARDQQIAKKMIAEFYSRVELANQQFTSLKEGWKTDRGIIYIVYGIPFLVEIHGDREFWLYGEENNILSVKFVFEKQNGTWSNNEYNLIKDTNYKNNWYRAVDAWRQGRIYQ